MPYQKEEAEKMKEAQCIEQVIHRAFDSTWETVMSSVAMNFHEPWHLPGRDHGENVALFRKAQQEMEKFDTILVQEGGRTYAMSSHPNPQRKYHGLSGEFYSCAETTQFVNEMGGSLSFALNMWKTQMTAPEDSTFYGDHLQDLAPEFVQDALYTDLQGEPLPKKFKCSSALCTHGFRVFFGPTCRPSVPRRILHVCPEGFCIEGHEAGEVGADNLQNRISRVPGPGPTCRSTSSTPGPTCTKGHKLDCDEPTSSKFMSSESIIRLLL